MSIEVDAGDIERAQMLLAGIPQAADKAVANSLNRSIVAARTAISKGIRGEYVVSAGDVKCELENLGNLNENWQSSVLR